MDKTELKNAVLRARDRLEPDRRRELAGRAAAHVTALPEWRAASTVMLYAAFRSEMPTLPLLEAALAQGKRVAFPKADPAAKAMAPLLVARAADLAPGAYGIPEPDPARCAAVDPSRLDLVVVPGAVFDARGHRLGYGAGYYDRFLPRCPGAFALGLGFALQRAERVPDGPHDVRLAALATEDGVIRF